MVPFLKDNTHLNIFEGMNEYINKKRILWIYSDLKNLVNHWLSPSLPIRITWGAV